MGFLRVGSLLPPELRNADVVLHFSPRTGLLTFRTRAAVGSLRCGFISSDPQDDICRMRGEHQPPL